VLPRLHIEKLIILPLKMSKIFNYLGSILNAHNKINIEIAERIAKGNKAYCANAKPIKSKFLKKKTKIEILKENH
jgi:hypothetical protein